MAHREFLDRFENAKSAAEAFAADVTIRDISHWKMRGIPSRYWYKAEQIAKERGWPETAQLLDDTKPDKPIRKRDLPRPVIVEQEAAE